uniref:Uncharacterized protein n=1 Tax=Avena sativa TaxID=4498 RepID=A0ACD5VGK8_AVESA
MSSTMLATGICSQMQLPYGIASLKGRLPALTDAVGHVPSFSRLSPPMAMDFFGVFDGSFGAYSARHQAERLHVAVAQGIEDLAAEAPRFLEFPQDVVGWWRKTILDAFRLVDDELVAGAAGGVALGSPTVMALVLSDYLVVANRGATCGAVIYRGEEAVQLTSEPRPEKEVQNAENRGGHVVGSTSNLEDNMTTSHAILFKPYDPIPEVLVVDRKPQDKFLILASSGVWDHVTPLEACSFIQTRLCTSPITIPLTIIAKELAELAMCNGSRRNATVAIIPFNNFV